MTCSHALDLIDAGSLVDVTPTVNAALQAHAATCAPCRAALSFAGRLSLDLVDLTDVTAPPALASSIEARIAALSAPVREVSASPEPAPDWRAWLTLSGAGAAMAVLIPSYTMTPDLTQLVRTSEPAFLLEARAISTASLLVSVSLFLLLIFKSVGVTRGRFNSSEVL